MTKPWGLYVLPMEGQPEFQEVPYDAWNDRFGWTSGKCRRPIEASYVTDDRKVQVRTSLYAQDLEGRLHLEEPWANPWVYGFPPAVPFLRGTVVVASFLQAGDGRELPLNVATLYGKTGIEAIMRWPSFHLDGIPRNMNYVKRKVAELQNMPKEE
ncbi:TPA: hypothetical protein ACH3X2_003206 [Trebouxia sp. C0005]